MVRLYKVHTLSHHLPSRTCIHYLRSDAGRRSHTAKSPHQDHPSPMAVFIWLSLPLDRDSPSSLRFERADVHPSYMLDFTPRFHSMAGHVSECGCVWKLRVGNGLKSHDTRHSRQHTYIHIYTYLALCLVPRSVAILYCFLIHFAFFFHFAYSLPFRALYRPSPSSESIMATASQDARTPPASSQSLANHQRNPVPRPDSRPRTPSVWQGPSGGQPS